MDHEDLLLTFPIKVEVAKSTKVKNLNFGQSFYHRMIPPNNAKVYEGELADFWLDEDGILCAVSKMTPRTLENQKANYDLIRGITGNKRVCLLADNTLTYEQDDSTRNYMAAEIPKVFKAMAVISRTVFGKGVSDTFLYYHGTPIPIKTFKEESEARQWLMQYLEA